MQPELYLETTVPSHYDLDALWCCTLGKYELEEAAWLLVRHLQENGDEWRGIDRAELDGRPDSPPFVVWPTRSDGLVAMPESWLALLQRTRKAMPGPPELVRNRRARFGLQFVYPNGHRRAAAFDFDEPYLRELSRDPTLRTSEEAA